MAGVGQVGKNIRDSRISWRSVWSLFWASRRRLRRRERGPKFVARLRAFDTIPFPVGIPSLRIVASLLSDIQ
jgi:hypothetical protein